MTKTVVIVEDDDQLRSLLQISLELEGFRVLAARHGEEAKPLLDAAVDLVLTDLQMPVMDGLSFVRWLRAEADLHVPVLVLTAMGKEGARQDALEAGADGVVHKPVDVDELSERVIGILDQPD